MMGELTKKDLKELKELMEKATKFNPNSKESNKGSMSIDLHVNLEDWMPVHEGWTFKFETNKISIKQTIAIISSMVLTIATAIAKENKGELTIDERFKVFVKEVIKDLNKNI